MKIHGAFKDLHGEKEKLASGVFIFAGVRNHSNEHKDLKEFNETFQSYDVLSGLTNFSGYHSQLMSIFLDRQKQRKESSEAGESSGRKRRREESPESNETGGRKRKRVERSESKDSSESKENIDPNQSNLKLKTK